MTSPLISGQTPIEAALDGDQYRVVSSDGMESTLGFNQMYVGMQAVGLNMAGIKPEGTAGWFNASTAGLQVAGLSTQTGPALAPDLTASAQLNTYKA